MAEFDRLARDRGGRAGLRGRPAIRPVPLNLRVIGVTISPCRLGEMGVARLLRVGCRLAVVALVSGCAAQTATVAAPPTPVPFDQAVLNAGNAVLTAASGSVADKRLVVIDPLVNGVTGEQTSSTRQLGSRLAKLAQEHYPLLDVQPFTAQCRRRLAGRLWWVRSRR